MVILMNRLQDIQEIYSGYIGPSVHYLIDSFILSYDNLGLSEIRWLGPLSSLILTVSDLTYRAYVVVSDMCALRNLS